MIFICGLVFNFFRSLSFPLEMYSLPKKDVIESAMIIPRTGD